MAYFKFFPKILYDVRGVTNQQNFDSITDITKRVLLKSNSWKKTENNVNELLEGTSGFVKHLIQDGDRPETIAYQFYGDSELHWIILYANGATLLNPYYDWPMTQFDLKKFVEKKYGASNINAINHYVDSNDNIVEKQGEKITPTSEGGALAGTSTIVTNFQHEEKINDAKRPIRILQSEYVNLVINEFEKLLSS